MSKESQGPSLGVHLIEVSLKRELTVFPGCTISEVCLTLIHSAFFIGKSKGHTIKCYYNDIMLMIIQVLESTNKVKFSSTLLILLFLQEFNLKFPGKL